MSPIFLDDHLIQEVKELAAAEGRSLEEIVEEALRERLARGSASSGPERVDLPVYWDGTFKPGVSINSNVALFDLLDLADAGG